MDVYINASVYLIINKLNLDTAMLLHLVGVERVIW